MSENRKDSCCFHENYVEHFRKTQRQVTKKKSFFNINEVREKIYRNTETFCTQIS